MTVDLGRKRTKDVEECPSCSSGSFTIVGHATGLTLTIAGREFAQPEYVIRSCSRCSLLYRTPNLIDEELSEYYDLVDYRKWETAGFFPTERRIHHRLRRLRKGARILDFGCSSGRLLAPLAVDYDCHGFEINPDAARAAASKGLRMVSEDSLETQACGSFDVIILSDVFEHLSSPMFVLRKVRNLLKTGGELILVTGNSDAAACRADPANFWYFRTPEHLCMMNRRHAGFIEQELRLSLIDWKTVSHFDASLVQRIFQAVRHFAYWEYRRKSFFGRRILPLVPWLQKARDWNQPPLYMTSADHVLAVFRKL
jgi:SAM-dependent methyltransferase